MFRFADIQTKTPRHCNRQLQVQPEICAIRA